MYTLFTALFLSISIIGSTASLFAAARGPGRPAPGTVSAAAGGAGVASGGAGGGAGSEVHDGELSDAEREALMRQVAELIKSVEGLQAKMGEIGVRIDGTVRGYDELAAAADARLLCACEKNVHAALQVMLATPGFDLRCDVAVDGPAIVARLGWLSAAVRDRYTLGLDAVLGRVVPRLDAAEITWAKNIAMYCQAELDRDIKGDDAAQRKTVIAESLGRIVAMVSESCDPEVFYPYVADAQRHMEDKVRIFNIAIEAVIAGLNSAAA